MIASWLIDALIGQNVKTFCIAPGSRSSPLVIALLNHPQKKDLFIHFDERGLGFFAMGAALVKNEPTVLIVTSGTALGNLLPSVMESFHSRIPILLLTGDRPGRLRDCAANQTTDQVKFFRPFVHFDMDLHENLDQESIRSIAAQSVMKARFSKGPIHLNLAFDEPLHASFPYSFSKAPIQIHPAKLSVEPYKTKKKKGIILIGKLEDTSEIKPILDLGKRLGWPIFADILSNARCFEKKELLTFQKDHEKMHPELVLHFGDPVTDKPLRLWLQKIKPHYVHISSHEAFQDPERILSERVQCSIPLFCEEFQAPKDSFWLDKWLLPLSSSEEENDDTIEAHLFKSLAKIIPEGFGYFFGNGMPIRDANLFFFPKKPKAFFANRGLSGIDGNIATIAGLSLSMPIFAVIGDLAALHDLNSFPLLKKSRHPVILLILNNFGGGVFHHLPIASHPQFETFWAAAHCFGFKEIAKMFDLPYFSFPEIKKALKTPRVAVVEALTDRGKSCLYHKDFRART